MNRLVRMAIRQGWRRGVLEGKRSWLVVGGIGLTARAVHSLVGRKEVVVYSEPLETGAVLLISNLREDRSGKRAD